MALPAGYVPMPRLPTGAPSYSLLPNLNGLFSGHTHSSGRMAVASGIVPAAATVAMWRARLTIALAATLLSGLLLSYHVFIADAVLLIPVGLPIHDEASRAQRAVGVILLSPPARSSGSGWSMCRTRRRSSC